MIPLLLLNKKSRRGAAFLLPMPVCASAANAKFLIPQLGFNSNRLYLSVDFIGIITGNLYSHLKSGQKTPYEGV